METRRIMLIYIAGPYTADTTYRVKMNILAAEYRAIEVMKTGMNMYPVCPHKNTEFMEGLRDGDYFIQGTKELMLRCDAVLLVDTDCANSVGTQGEIAAAKEAGIPVFNSLLDLRAWCNNEDMKPKQVPFMERIRKHFTNRIYSEK